MRPQGAVRVEVTLPAGSPVSRIAFGLAFTAGNWNTAQTVTVDAPDDTNAAGETARIRHSVDDAMSSDDFDNAADVYLTDNDTAAISVSQRGALTLPEGGSGTYTVQLSDVPTGSVVVEVLSGDSAAATVNGAGSQNLSFSTTTWNTAQTVTVAAVHDGDLTNETVTIGHQVDPDESPDEYNAAAAVDVTVNVTDDNGLRVVPRAVTVREGSTAGATYTMALKSQPSGQVAVTIGVPTGDQTALTTTPNFLTFTNTNWNEGQTVTVAAAVGANDPDAADRTVALLHAVAPYNYAAQAADDVTVTIDDETAALVLSRSAALALREGETATYTVRLGTLPAAGDVEVRVSSADAGAVTVNKAGGTAGAAQTLTFGAGNWNTGQAITVAAAQDADGAHEAVTLTNAVVAGNSADEYDGVAAETLAVEVTDDEGAEIVVSRGTGVLALAETGTTSATYTVRLSVLPTAAVTVRAGTGVDDADGVDPAAATVRHTLTSADTQYSYAARTTEQVTVMIEDDETPGVIVSRLRLALQEDPTAGGGRGRHIGTYTMVLGSAISGSGANVGGQILSSDPQAVQVRTALLPFSSSPNQWRVVFEPDDWNVPQTVTAQGDDDGRDEEVELRQEIFAVSGDAWNQGYVTGTQMVPLAVPNTTVTVIDDEEPALMVDTAPGTAGVQTGAVEVEEGSMATAAYTLALSVLPTAAVTVRVASGDTSAVTVAPATLTFTTTSWEMAQTVTVRAGEDDDAATWTHDPSGANYDNVANVELAFTVTDDETRAVVVDSDPGTEGIQTAALAVTEEHETAGRAAYTVALATQPVGGAVTVTIASSDGPAAVAEPAQLVFTAGNWATARTVAAVAQGDTDGNDESVTLTHTAAGADYPAAPAETATVTVTVTVTDDDVPGLWVSPLALTVAEPGTYRVRLNTAPGGPVTVGIADTTNNADVRAGVHDDDVEHTAPTVTADADGADETATLAHTVTGTHTLTGAAEYAGGAGPPVVEGVTAASVTVTVEDDEEQGLTLNPTSVTVTVRADADARAETATLTHTAAGGDYTATPPVTAELPVTVTDDAGVVVSRRGLTVVAGSTATYTVVLAAQQAGLVTVTAGLPSGTSNMVTVGPVGNLENRALVFTTGNWQTAQVVTVTGVGATAGFVRVVPQALTVLEGARGTYTVGLGTDPGGLVTASNDANSDITRAPGALTFTGGAPGTWGTAQTVTDAGTSEGLVTITHTVAGYSGVTVGPFVNVSEDEDETPTLGSVPNQTYWADRAVNVRLPAATGEGNPPVTSAWSWPATAPSTHTLPAGLAFDAATRRLRGTPQMTAPAATDAATPQTFTVTVDDDPLTFDTTTVEAQRHRLNRAVRQELPPVPMSRINQILRFYVRPALPAGLT